MSFEKNGERKDFKRNSRNVCKVRTAFVYVKELVPKRRERKKMKNF